MTTFLISIFPNLLLSLTFIFSVYKYISEKKIERKNEEFKHFIIILDRVSGRYENGNLMVDVQQIAALYQLLEFKRYSYISIPVLNHFIEKSSNDSNSAFRKAVLFVCNELKK